MGFLNEGLDVLTINVNKESTNVEALKVFYAKNATYHFGIYAAKAALLCFYTRLIPKTMKKTRVCLWITVAILAIGFTVGTLLNFFLCVPISKNWNPKSNCSSGWTFVTGSVTGSVVPYIFHILTNIMIYVLPFSVLRVLLLPTPQKIGVGIIFALGFLCILFAVSVIVIGHNSTSATTNWVVAIFEHGLGVCVACAPALKGLTAVCDSGRWKGGISCGRGDNRDTDSEAGTVDCGSRPQSDATIFDRDGDENLDRAPNRIESLLGQDEIEKPPLSRLVQSLPKITPTTAYNRQSRDTEDQQNSPSSPGYTMSISSIVDFYDLERQLQLDDEKRQTINCSPVLERRSSEGQPNSLLSKDCVDAGLEASEARGDLHAVQ
ncbi:hypothetical protein TWF730_002639 [Orbilia blumenaviensis]|uniref:Rhodopsin domain-containing protein n=1 Tax=Orbilia blumenaviensis TaxID=1796055 RepID=A0AAV9UDJ3_9PEZI